MSAFKNSKRNNKSRNNYRIESLEPRLLMDASHRAESWCNEISSIAAPVELDESDADSFYGKFGKASTVIDGMYKLDEKLGTLSSPVKLSDLSKIDADFKKLLPQPTAEDVLESVKQNLKTCFNGVNAGTKLTASQAFDIIKRDAKTSVDAQTGVASREICSSYGDSIKSKLDIFYDISCNGQKISIDVCAQTSLAEYSSALGELFRDCLAGYGADIKDFENIGIGANFDFAGYTRGYGFSFDLDGDKSNGVGLSSTLSLLTMYDESHEENKREDVQYGVLGLYGDRDESVDLLIGRSLTVKNGKVSATNGITVDLDLKLKDPNLFSTATGLKPLPKSDQKNEKTYLKYTKAFLSTEGVWEVYAGDSKNKIELEKYDKITMGRILGKLQELSVKLTGVQEGDFENNVNFGGVLSQNANSLMNLSRMLDDALMINLNEENKESRCPETIQELVNSLNKSVYKSGSNVKIDIDEDGKNLIIPFSLKYVEKNSSNKNVSDIESEVALAKNYLESLLNVKILTNGSVKFTSSATLQFNLVIPLEEMKKAQESSLLKDVGLDGNNDTLKMIVGANSVIADAAVGGWSEDYLKKYGDSLNNVLAGNGTDYRCRMDVSTGHYVLYTKGTFDDEQFKNFWELQNTSVQTGFVLEWNKKCKSIKTCGKTYSVNGIQDAVNTLNYIYENDPNFGVDTYAMAFDDKIIVFFSGTDEEMHYLNNGKKMNIAEVEEKYSTDNIYQIIVSNDLMLKSFEKKASFKISVNGKSSKTVVLDVGSFLNLSDAGVVASRLQQRIDDVFGWNSPEKELLRIESFEKKIRFVSCYNFTVDFSGNVEFAQWLGFTDISKDKTKITQGAADSSCMQIVVKGVDTPYVIDLKDFVNKKSSGKTQLCNLTVGEILQAISDCTDGKIQKSGNGLKAKSGKITKIENINGYNLASMLGLAGELADSPREGRTSFDVDVCLIDELQEASSIKFENFDLKITNTITSGKLSVPANYGVFGVTLNGDLNGLKCVTEFGLTDGKLSSLGSPSFTYSNSKKELTLKLKQPISGTENLGSLMMEKAAACPCNYIATREMDEAALGQIEYYSADYLVIEDVYNGVSEQINALYKYFTSEKAGTSLLKNSALPIYGKDVLEIMDVRSKISDALLFLGRGYDCATIQELSSAFKKRTGISLNFTLNETGLFCDLTWQMKAVKETVELSNLGLGVKSFSFKSQINALMDANLTLTARIKILAKGKFELDLTDDHKPKIDGTVSITANNIESDSIISIAVGSTTFTNTYHIGTEDKYNSYLSLSAEFGHDEEGSETANMSVSGELNLFRYGDYVGTAFIGVAGTDGDYSDLQSDFDYSLQTHSYGAAAVWKNDGTEQILSNKNAKSVAAGDIVVDVRGIGGLKKIQLIDKLCDVSEGLNTTARRIQGSLLSVLVKEDMRNIPLIGDNIINAGGCLDRLNKDIFEPIRKFFYGLKFNLDWFDIVKKLKTIFEKCSEIQLDESLEDCSKKSVTWAGKEFDRYYKGVQFGFVEEDGEVVDNYCRIRLKGVYELASNADFDLGYPGLGLNAEGGVKISMEWTLDIGFGTDSDGGYVLFSNGQESMWFNEKDIDIENGGEKALEKAKKAVEENAENSLNNHLGDDFTARIKIEPSEEINGSLGFLSLIAEIKAFEDEEGFITLGLDFNDGDQDKKAAGEDWESDAKAETRIDTDLLDYGIHVEAGLRGELPIYVEMLLGLGGYEENVPHIQTTLGLTWTSSIGQENPFGSLKEVKLTGIVFDCGSYIRNTVGTVIRKINNALKPIQPLVNFLQSDMPVLSKLPSGKDCTKVLDFIKKFGKGKKMNFKFLDDLVQLDEFVNKMNEYVNTGFAFSDVVLYAENAMGELNKMGMDYLNGKIVDAENFVTGKFQEFKFKFSHIVEYAEEFKEEAVKTWEDTKNAVTNAYDDGKQAIKDAYADGKQAAKDAYADVKAGMKKWAQGESSSSSKTNVKTPEFGGSFKIPLLSSDTVANEVMKLLMGGHVDLIEFDMNPLEFSFDWSKSFPIVGPLCADIGFNFDVSIDLCFGYDTLGMEKWKASGYKDYAALADGFYIEDWDSYGNDVSEVVFHSGVIAGASLGGRVGVNVGLDLNVNLDLADPNNDGKIRLAELADLFSDPLNMFEASASIEAKAYAYLDYFFGTKKWTLWSSGALDLFKTVSRKTKSGSPVLASETGNETAVLIGRFAEERENVGGDVTDGNDDVLITITSDDTVDVSWKKESDKNYYTQSNVKVGEGRTLAIYGGEGNDKITIKSENATVKANFDIVVYGENGDDNIDMESAYLADGYTAVVMGGAGKNVIYGAQGGENYLFGEIGMVQYYDKAGSDDRRVKRAEAYSVDETSGPNVIVGGNAFNVIFGGASSDLIVGGDFVPMSKFGVDYDGPVNYIFGDSGRYTYDSKSGEVSVDREDLLVDGGDDLIYGGVATDFIYGGAGNDRIMGLEGNDEIHGGEGNDIIYGGAGDDVVYGGDDVDIIFGDTPIDDTMVIAQKGDSKGVVPFVFAPSELNQTTIALFDVYEQYKSEHSELFDTKDGKDPYSGYVRTGEMDVGSDIIYGDNGSDIIFGDDGDNGSYGADDVIYGGAGNDFISGEGGNDTLYGDYGVDVLYGGIGADSLDGGAGDDFVFGDLGWKHYTNTSAVNTWVGETDKTSPSDFEMAYGDMLKVAGSKFGIAHNSVYKAAGGDDIITAGDGDDFVDGQAGNDVYKVRFQGGDKHGFTNVMDSGNDRFDKMNVFGTEYDDRIVISESGAGLGKIVTTSDKNVELERINFWGNTLEFISLETRIGNDVIKVNNTSTIMEIDAGGGNDEIVIGVTYDLNWINSVNPFDAFNLDSSLLKYSEIRSVDDKSVPQTGYITAGAQHALDVKAGSGDDIITVNHTNVSLTLFGNMGNDTFNFNSITDSDGNVVGNHGKIVVVGGGNEGDAGFDVRSRVNRINVTGPSRSTTYSIDGHQFASSNINVGFYGIADFYVKGGKKKDKFYLRDLLSVNYDIDSSSAGDQVIMAWTLDDEELVNRKCLSKDELEEKQSDDGNVKKAIDDEINNQTSNKKINVLVESNEKVISDGQYLLMKNLSDYSSLFGSITYSLTLSEAPSETVIVRVMVPNVSDDDALRGAAKVAINGRPDCVDLVFDKNNYNEKHDVVITNLKTSYLQRDELVCVYHDVITASDKDVVEASSVLLSFGYSDDGHYESVNGFTETVQCKISDCEYNSSTGRYTAILTVNPGVEGAKALDDKVKLFNEKPENEKNQITGRNYIHWEVMGKQELVGSHGYGKKIDFRWEVSGDKVILSWTSLEPEYLPVGADTPYKQVKMDADDIVCFSYVTNKWYLNEESSALLRSSMDDFDPYDDMAEKPKFVFKLVLDGDSTTYILRTEKESKSDDKYFYREDGHRIIICSKETGDAVQVTGVITLNDESLEWNMPKEFTVWARYEQQQDFKDSFKGDDFTVYKDPRGKKSYVAVHVPEDSNGKNYHIDMNLWNEIEVNWLGEKNSIEEWNEKYVLPDKSDADVVYIYLQDNVQNPCSGLTDNPKYPAYEGRLSAYYSNEPGK